MAEPKWWERIDEPVLRWVATLPPSLGMDFYELDLREPQPFEAIPDLDSKEVHDSLRRLTSYGLVASSLSLAGHDALWKAPRVTSSGWIVLGEWPDLDRVATAASLHQLLRALADNAPKEERGALLRAAGVVSHTADDVLRATATDVAKTFGKEAAGG